MAFDSLLELACQTRLRFYELGIDRYCDAFAEINRITYLLGLTPNDVARALQGKSL